MTWPLIAHLGTALPGIDGDAWVHLWTFNWVKTALLEANTPFFTHQLYYPNGVSLLFHNIAWVNIALWLPLQALIGEAAAYSIVYLFILAFNGFATYLFTQNIIRWRPAAAISGLIVAFWPYILSHNNHPNLVFIAWVPLALLFLRRMILFGQYRDALLAGVFIGLLGISRFQLLVIGGFLISFYVIYLFLTEPLARSWRRLALLLITGMISLGVVAPLAAPVIIAQTAREDPNDLFVEEDNTQTDLLAYLIPNHRHPLWGSRFYPFYENLGLNVNYVAFIGLTSLFLAVWGVRSNWPTSRVWLLAALLYIMLALGADLHVYGQHFEAPMLYDLLDNLFIVRLIRRSDRLNVILSIPIALLAGMGMAQISQRLSSWRATVATIIVALLILAEYATVFQTMPLHVPAWFQQLKDEPGEFAIVSIPMHPRWGSDKLNMMYQLTHGKPLVEGHVSRPPEEAFGFIESVPMLAQLRAGAEVPNLADPGRQFALLREAGVRYLILHRDYLSKEVERDWRDWLIADPDYTDDQLLVYRTDPVVGSDVTLEHVLLAGEPLLGVTNTTIVPEATMQSGWIEVNASWASGTILTKNYEVCLALLDAQGKTAVPQCSPLSSELPTGQWQAGELVHARYLIQIDPFFEPGTYLTRMTLKEESGTIVGNTIDLGEVLVTALPRTFVPPAPTHEVGVDWEGQIALVGYNLTRSTETPKTLAATFYWQARQRLPTSYKFFLHLIDTTNGTVMAQADWVPRDWSYPTSYWQDGEYVEDTIYLDVAGVPTGTYELFVGLYEPKLGERLEPAANADQIINRSLRLQSLPVD